jgi:hypothetical protein
MNCDCDASPSYNGLYIICYPPMRPPILYCTVPHHHLYACYLLQPLCALFATLESPISHVVSAALPDNVAQCTIPTNTTALSFTRNMSSSPTKRLFTIYAPDSTDPGTLERRISVREEHGKGIGRLRSDGIASMCISLQLTPLTTTHYIFFAQNLGVPFWHQNLPMRMAGKRWLGPSCSLRRKVLRRFGRLWSRTSIIRKAW